MKKSYSPHEFGQLIARSTRTLQEWDRKGILKACRTPTNRRYYTHEQYIQIAGSGIKRQIVVYSRVSSAGQKEDLARQQEALREYCAQHGKVVDEWLQDMGSGLNYERKQFVRLMDMVETGQVGEIIIAHKDRLVRFGFEWFEGFCQRHGTMITITNAQAQSPEEEVTQDLLSILHSFSSRLYGLRKYKKQIKKMVETHADD
jgi:predicted site-specific integrase-resolvase